MNPLVTVLLPVFNAEHYLPEALDSILSQTYTDFELLIIDDGSNDKSPYILSEYANKDNRLQIHTQPRNIGIVSALNLGIQLARGKYLARMDADDFSLSNRLEKQVAYLENHPEIGVLGTAATVINASGKYLYPMDYPVSHTLLLWALCFFCPIVHSTVIFRLNLLQKHCGYTSEFPLAEDYDLWVRLSKKTQLANLPERLLLLRKHDSNVSIVHRSKQIKNSAAISGKLISEFIRQEVPVIPLELAWSLRCISKNELSQVLKVIQALYEHFTGLPLTSLERKLLRRDFSLRLVRLLQNISLHKDAIDILIKALKNDPFAVGDILRLGLQKKLNRQKYNAYTVH
jgi:glycosyltransferase involved in cell wall biosynthesis